MNFAFSFLAGKDELYIQNLIEDFFEKELKHSFFEEALDLLRIHKGCGRVIIVSNAVDIVIKKIANFLEINEFICTKLQLTNGIYTGEIYGNISYGINKFNLIKDYFKEQNLTDILSTSYFYSDHISDLPMFTLVKYPIVVNPSKKLYNIAMEHGWPVLYFKKIT